MVQIEQNMSYKSYILIFDTSHLTNQVPYRCSSDLGTFSFVNFVLIHHSCFPSFVDLMIFFIVCLVTI